MTTKLANFKGFMQVYGITEAYWKMLANTLSFHYYVRGDSIVTDGEYDLVMQDYPFERPTFDLFTDYVSAGMLPAGVVLELVRAYMLWLTLMQQGECLTSDECILGEGRFAEFDIVWFVGSPTLCVTWYALASGDIAIRVCCYSENRCVDHERSICYVFKQSQHAAAMYQWYVRQFFNSMPR